MPNQKDDKSKMYPNLNALNFFYQTAYLISLMRTITSIKTLIKGRETFNKESAKGLHNKPKVDNRVKRTVLLTPLQSAQFITCYL